MNTRTVILMVALATVFGIGSFVGFRALTPNQAIAQVPRNANATSAEEASSIVGFAIASPTFIPNGFEGNNHYMINTVGQPSWAFKTVTRTWASKGDSSAFFILTQSAKQFDISGGQTIEINGSPGQRSVAENPGDGTRRLALAWTQDKMFFVLTGTMKNSLDEETMMDVIESVKLP